MKRYYCLDNYKIFDENMNEIGTFKCMNEVEGLQKIINVEDAGGKMLAKMHETVKLNKQYVVCMDEIPFSGLESAAKSVKPETWK